MAAVAIFATAILAANRPPRYGEACYGHTTSEETMGITSQTMTAKQRKAGQALATRRAIGVAPPNQKSSFTPTAPKTRKAQAELIMKRLGR